MLPPQPLFNKKHLVSVGLTVQFDPTTPVPGPPSGVAYFELTTKAHHGPHRPKILGTATLVGGGASLTFKAKQVLNKSITIFFSSVDYQPVSLIQPRLTFKELKALAR